MTVPFGPQLIGRTEKSLNALLEQLLAGRVTEREWVVLRLAGQGSGDLVHDARETAHFVDAADLVAGLAARGLLADGALTAAGVDLVDQVLARIAERVGPIWADLDRDDVAAAERVLNEVLHRAGTLLTAR